MTLTGAITIYRHDTENGRTLYSRRIAWHPYEDGAVNTSKWVSVIESVDFKEGDPDLPNKTKINVIEAFESGYVYKGEPRRKIVIKEWHVIDDEPDNFAELSEKVPF